MGGNAEGSLRGDAGSRTDESRNLLETARQMVSVAVARAVDHKKRSSKTSAAFSVGMVSASFGEGTYSLFVPTIANALRSWATPSGRTPMRTYSVNSTT